MSVTYRRSLFVGLFVIVACLFNPPPSESQHRCIKCHSKRPGAVAMHDALEGKDCFDCHVRGEKLRQKGGIPKEKHEAFLKQRNLSTTCGHSPLKITVAIFCPSLVLQED